MSIPKNSLPVLIDNHGRRMDYLRLAITDRCNLRCQYCMPAEGVEYVPRKEIMTWEEMYRICRILVAHGLRKIRITGGEPFLRKDLTTFLGWLMKLEPQPHIGITTNGTLLHRYLLQLKEIGIRHLNISLDTLSPETFQQITRRDQFDKTWNSLVRSVEMGFVTKINMVIQPGVNDHEITEFARLTKDMPVTVRYIEPMPFSGCTDQPFVPFSGDRIKNILKESFDLQPVRNQSVDTQFGIPGYKGYVGIIYAYSRTFCDTCSRMRISVQGQMRTCLYGENVLDLRKLLRNGVSDEKIFEDILEVLQHRYKNGFEAEKSRLKSSFESMASIGG